ncbi:hypothetical protein EAF00_007415 [Botryotinia globosa]|nr:hypothetical protein EAF00_007415 [Botryotinia globosa]
MYLASEESLTVQSHEFQLETTKFFVSKVRSGSFLTSFGLYLDLFEATDEYLYWIVYISSDFAKDQHFRENKG